MPCHSFSGLRTVSQHSKDVIQHSFPEYGMSFQTTVIVKTLQEKSDNQQPIQPFPIDNITYIHYSAGHFS